jgi:hypothetical protein
MEAQKDRPSLEARAIAIGYASETVKRMRYMDLEKIVKEQPVEKLETLDFRSFQPQVRHPGPSPQIPETSTTTSRVYNPNTPCVMVPNIVPSTPKITLITKRDNGTMVMDVLKFADGTTRLTEHVGMLRQRKSAIQVRLGKKRALIDSTLCELDHEERLAIDASIERDIRRHSAIVREVDEIRSQLTLTIQRREETLYLIQEDDDDEESSGKDQYSTPLIQKVKDLQILVQTMIKLDT